jgi:pimeloyl-ACP methyl ester carboxylesterase
VSPGYGSSVPPTDRITDLDPLSRAVYETTVLADVALRTALGSVITGAMAPWGLTRNIKAENRRLGFYRDLAAEPDPERVFRTPPRVDVTTMRPGRITLPLQQRGAEVLRFASPYQAINPAVRAAYGRHSRNRIAYAQHWRHEDGPRPTLCVIHGFGASPYWLNSAFFALPWFFAHGYDVLLYTMPFHGLRRGMFAPLNGTELFAHGVCHLNEAIIHAVHDFRVFVDHLERTGVEQIGLTGLSLGGYMTALLAAVEPRLQFVIPNAAVTDMKSLIRTWFPTNQVISAVTKLRGLPREEIENALAVHSPMTYQPVVPKNRMMIIGGLGDRLAPPEQSERLWEHWDRPRIHWFVGNHVMHLSRGAYLREMRRFMAEADF